MQTAAKDVEDIEYIAALVYERSRIHLHPGKHQLIRARLGKRLRHHGFAGLHQYCQYLRDGAGEDEINQLVDALATNFTQFLREPDHFDFLRYEALPGLLGERPRPSRIWSAACATGEEPYSIAFHDWTVKGSCSFSRRGMRKESVIIRAAAAVGALAEEFLEDFGQVVGAHED